MTVAWACKPLPFDTLLERNELLSSNVRIARVNGHGQLYTWKCLRLDRSYSMEAGAALHQARMHYVGAARLVLRARNLGRKPRRA